jgi:hypothetical protein
VLERARVAVVREVAKSSSCCRIRIRSSTSTKLIVVVSVVFVVAVEEV